MKPIFSPIERQESHIGKNLRNLLNLWLFPTLRLFIIFFIFFSSVGIACSENVGDMIRQGDQSFNRGDYRQALKLYQQAAAQVGAQSALFAEIVNNMAAVNMAQGDLQAFYQNFTRAKELKQRLVPKLAAHAVSRPTDKNLLINGGFEDGLIFPWGTGHYESMDGKFQFGLWWNSMNANAFMKVDTAETYSGVKSLQITNYSPSASHVFTTLSQRITGLQPNRVYKISCYVKANDVPPSAVLVIVDAAWAKRFALPSGTYEWQPFSVTVNIGHNDYIDFRIVHQSTGSVWFDDIIVEEMTAIEEADAWQQAERLFDSARYADALQAYAELEKQYRENEGALRHVKWYAGRVHLALGQYDRAFENFSWAVNKGIDRANIDLAELYYYLGDFEIAIQYFAKSLDIVKEDQGTVSLIWNKLSQCYLASGKLEEALRAQEYAYFVLKHIEDQHGQALALNQLGVIYQRQQAYDRAREQFLMAYQLAGRLDDQKLHSDAALNLAETAYLNQDYAEARTYLNEVLPIKEALADQIGQVKTFRLQGQLAAAENKLEDAVFSYRRAVSLLETVAAGVADISRETKAAFMQQFSQLYREYVELLLILFQRTQQATYHQEAFQVAEQARSRTFTEMVTESRAIQAFAATSKDSEFKAWLEQERQLNAEIYALQKQIQQPQTQSLLENRQEIARRLDQAKQERQTLQAQITQNYPRYADLKTPQPLHVEDVQNLLGTDEAAISYFVTPTHTAVWAINKEQALCAVIQLTRLELIQQSESFRSTFAKILMEWEQFSGTANDEARLRSVLMYPVEQAFALYTILIAPVEQIIRSKRVVYLAPDDLLYKLPFEALLTKPFTFDSTSSSVIGAELQHAPFWVKTQAIAYLPSLSVLRSLRTFEKAQFVTQSSLLAFADPIFAVPKTSVESTDASQLRTFATRSALLRGLSVDPAVRLPSLTETREEARMEWILPPLPDTREEALAVAFMLGADPEQAVYLQENATESTVKNLSLRSYKTLLFATHGLMAGEFGPGAQPALALSFVGDPGNDGLLEMSEILGLDLNADLVVLSACNTASGTGEEDRGEGFAGLTRSFMYAGARSLFVTQWSVESSSAKTLVQTTFRQMSAASKVEALAQAKRDMIKGQKSVQFSPNLRVSLAHPLFWAPYILVGETR
ncbi:TPR repeat protein [Candidatus Vecturithrix granuli]|uniref:TPR repeat protein n=1 Tax=Vecturithrix granuli TaxID=1499967 RepID=A0A081C393_VECG1|nr:TPR repeat protein [Candidatus Vecturithrix granuli]